MKPTRTPVLLSGLALAAALISGCGDGPPGAGITNGPPPDLSSEKPAMRTDLPERNLTNRGEMKGAGGTNGIDGGNPTGSPTSGTSTGKGMSASGAGPGAGGTSSPTTDPGPRVGAARKDTIEAVGEASSQPPSTKDGTAPGSAAGATKPSGDIKVGTPKGPQL